MPELLEPNRTSTETRLDSGQVYDVNLNFYSEALNI